MLNYTPVKFQLINILIRTTYRPSFFKLCIKSILEQHYSMYRIIICYDDDRCLDYLNQYKQNSKITIFKAGNVDKNKPFFYNLYMNELIYKVNNGWILFLDDDNMFSSDMVLQNLRHILINPDNIIFWKVKQGKQIVYPKDINHIEKFYIDTGGFCFHSKHKNLSYWEHKQNGDYYFITKLLANFYFNRKFIDHVCIRTIHGSSSMGGLKEQLYSFEEFIKSNNIKQIYISGSLAHLKPRLLKKYRLREYYNKNEPCIFFGIYIANDVKVVNSHKTTRFVLFGGSDVPNIKYLTFSCILLSLSDDIYSRLKTYKILSTRMYLNLVDTNIFKPVKIKGPKIFIYDGIRKKPDNDNIYGKKYYDEVIKQLPEYEYIFSSDLNLPYEKMPEIYKQCSLGLRLTKHDGNANMVQEMEAMNIPVVHNQSNYGLKWNTVEDIIVYIKTYNKKCATSSDYKSINIENTKDYNTLNKDVNGDSINELNFIKNIQESNIMLYYNNKIISGDGTLKPEITISRNKNYNNIINKNNVFLSPIPYEKYATGHYIITKSMYDSIRDINSLLYPHVFETSMYNEINKKPFFLQEQKVSKSWYNWYSDEEIYKLKLKYFPENAFIICICGRIAINSYPKSLLEAVKLLRQQGHNIYILALTKFEVSPHRLTQNLYDEITSYEWVKSFVVNKKDVLNYFRVCDILASTYRDYCNHIGGSNKIKEFLLCDKPIMCSRGKERELELGKNYSGFYECKTCDTVPPLCWMNSFLKNPYIYNLQYKKYFKNIDDNINNITHEINDITNIIYNNIFKKKTFVKNLVSIIIPLFNNKEYFQKTLASIINQKYKKLEIIIVNDNSPQTYPYINDFIKEFSTQYKIIYIKNKKNLGCYISLNIGIINSSGEYITILGSDDKYTENRILLDINNLKLNPNKDVAVSKYTRTNIYGETVEDFLTKYRYGKYGDSMVTFKRNIFSEIGFFCDTKFGGDSEFLNRLIEFKTKKAVMHIDNIGYVSFEKPEMEEQLTTKYTLVVRKHFSDNYQKLHRRNKTPTIRLSFDYNILYKNKK